MATSRGAETVARLLDTTERLLAGRGASGTGLNEVCERSGVAYGSLYHHFPGGKDQLVEAAISRAGGTIGALLDALLGSMDLAGAVTTMFAAAAQQLRVNDFSEGCPVGTPGADELGESPRIAAGAALDGWSAKLADAAQRGGAGSSDGQMLASALVSLYEGALLRARVGRNTQPLDDASAAATMLIAGVLSPPPAAGRAGR